jgi:hypothetical protein
LLEPFEDDPCKLILLELEYQAAYYRYWYDLGIKTFKPNNSAKLPRTKQGITVE